MTGNSPISSFSSIGVSRNYYESLTESEKEEVKIYDNYNDPLKKLAAYVKLYEESQDQQYQHQSINNSERIVNLYGGQNNLERQKNANLYNAGIQAYFAVENSTSTSSAASTSASNPPPKEMPKKLTWIPPEEMPEKLTWDEQKPKNLSRPQSSIQGQGRGLELREFQEQKYPGQTLKWTTKKILKAAAAAHEKGEVIWDGAWESLAANTGSIINARLGYFTFERIAITILINEEGKIQTFGIPSLFRTLGPRDDRLAEELVKNRMIKEYRNMS